eukprot:CAMPEP_0172793058 /NCGR_PEP_ID=MMETSP1074-20121228/209288_1 /TAXON_ID=2916 /ORGANISM="Ceratium fusus, Strain PA161109" /LENGTH=136 /DNA_ID=CAMNT_0013630131 /DNA_START=600 /DNA_END=1008 /DNA_ORIENTATION=-
MTIHLTLQLSSEMRQRTKLWSMDADNAALPCGEKQQHEIPATCPRSVRTRAPSYVRKSLSVKSWEPESTCWSSGEKQHAAPTLLWASKVCTNVPSTDQSCSTSSSDADKSNLPSAEKVQWTTGLECPVNVRSEAIS